MNQAVSITIPLTITVSLGPPVIVADAPPPQPPIHYRPETNEERRARLQDEELWTPERTWKR